jgi:2-methylcitrate dehydratase PrpD
MSSNGCPTAQPIEFAVSISTTVIPQIAFDNACRCLLDAIGCGLFGASQP